MNSNILLPWGRKNICNSLCCCGWYCIVWFAIGGMFGSVTYCSGPLLLVRTLWTLRAPLDTLGWCLQLHNRSDYACARSLPHRLPCNKDLFVLSCVSRFRDTATRYIGDPAYQHAIAPHYKCIMQTQYVKPVWLETVRHRRTIETRLIDERRRVQSTAVVVERWDALRLARQCQPGEGASGVAARGGRVLLEGCRPGPHRVSEHGIHLL